MSYEYTPWFDGNVLPARPGVYQRFIRSSIFYSLWTGAEWRTGWLPFRDKPEQAVIDRAAMEVAPSDHRTSPWRGLASATASGLAQLQRVLEGEIQANEEENRGLQAALDEIYAELHRRRI